MAYEILTANLPASDAVSIRTTIPMAQLQDFFGPAFHELSEIIRTGGANPAGPPFVRYYSVTPRAVDLEAVMSCDQPVVGAGRIKAVHLDASQAAIVRHVGHYEKMKPAYEAITNWMRNNDKHPSEMPREVYVTHSLGSPTSAGVVTLVEQPIA